MVEEAAVDQAVARDATSAAKSAIWPEAASLDQAPVASPDQAGETVVVSQHPERSRIANGYKDFFSRTSHVRKEFQVILCCQFKSRTLSS